MKKFLLLIAIAFMFSCAEDEVTELKQKTISFEYTDFEGQVLYDDYIYYLNYNAVASKFDKISKINIVSTETEFYRASGYSRYFYYADGTPQSINAHAGFRIFENFKGRPSIAYHFYYYNSSNKKYDSVFVFDKANVTYYYTE